MFWINSGEMNIAERPLNHKKEARGIWWFCFLHDISNSYLPSAGQRWMNCQAMLHVVFSGCMDLRRTGDSVQLFVFKGHCHRLSPSHLQCGKERAALSFPLVAYLHLCLVSLSPQGKWGTRQANCTCKNFVVDPAWHRPDLWNCSSFLRLCSVLSACWRFPAVLLDRSAEQ